jgi:hypothetical protein
MLTSANFRLTALVLAFGASPPATAQQTPLSPASHPRTFCELASDLGYPSRGYKDHTGGCASNMIEVTPTRGSNGLNNNLAFYSMGETDSPGKLQRVSLILNVNNTREKAKAHAELARVASGVAAKILGKAPTELASILRQGGSRTWDSGAWTVEVKTSVWPTGLGQDTTVYFRPK